jgi:hypothetical protein
MSRFLIELRHEDDQMACARFVKLILTSGSHFLTHAEWGCKDGEHSAWIIVEMDSKEEARTILPPPFRSKAKIVALNHFTIDQIDGMLSGHLE